mgnify:CR=1 FL=1
MVLCSGSAHHVGDVRKDTRGRVWHVPSVLLLGGTWLGTLFLRRDADCHGDVVRGAPALVRGGRTWLVVGGRLWRVVPDARHGRGRTAWRRAGRCRGCGPERVVLALRTRGSVADLLDAVALRVLQTLDDGRPERQDRVPDVCAEDVERLGGGLSRHVIGGRCGTEEGEDRPNDVRELRRKRVLGCLDEASQRGEQRRCGLRQRRLQAAEDVRAEALGKLDDEFCTVESERSYNGDVCDGNV